jgi:proton-dependent oligopeptide transporter, POT family
MASTALRASPGPTGRSLRDHPPGLFVLAGTELWDRVSFHGMLALLTLYMAERLFVPGHIEAIAGFGRSRAMLETLTGPLSTEALAAQIFGLYTGLAYFSPLVGGWCGDRLIGRRRSVATGALLMAGGHFCMAFDRTFLLALLLLICGAGLLRPNLASQLGALYPEGDRRRDDAFQFYVAMLNSGAFLAPLITGLLAKDYGWHIGFGFAGIGMIVGLATYLAGSAKLPADPPRAQRQVRIPLTPQERRQVAALIALLPMLTMFWIAQSQVWNVYNLWARDHLNLIIGTWTMPVPWLQSIDAVACVFLVPPLVAQWRWQAARGEEPDAIAKLGVGCLIFAIAMAWMAAGQLLSTGSGRVPLVWDLCFHLIAGYGYLYVQPVALGLFARTAPASMNARMMSVYYLSIFAGSTISGRLGGLYEQLSPLPFWLIHAAIVCAGGLLLLLLGQRFREALLVSRDLTVHKHHLGETAP